MLAEGAICCSPPTEQADRTFARFLTATSRSPTSSFLPSQWDSLQIPVSIAFFFLNSSLGRLAAFYPGTCGRHRVRAAPGHLGRGDRSESRPLYPRSGCRSVPRAEPSRNRSGAECFLVPIDTCYELVGQLRRLWRGFDGGSEANDAIDDFFAASALREAR